jgi:hypothetical protein
MKVAALLDEDQVDNDGQIVPVDKPKKTPQADAKQRDRTKTKMFFKLQTMDMLPDFINKLWAEAAQNPEGRRMLR